MKQQLDGWDSSEYAPRTLQELETGTAAVWGQTDSQARLTAIGQ